MRKILFLLFIVLKSTGQSLHKNATQSSTIDLKGNSNSVKVIQGNNVTIFDLNNEKDSQAFGEYLKTIPQINKELKQVLSYNKQTLDLVVKLVEKTKDYDVFNLEKFIEKFSEKVEENTKLKIELENLRNKTQDEDLAKILKDAEDKLVKFDNYGYQNTLETFKNNRKKKIELANKEIAKLAHLQAENSRINYDFEKAYEQILEALSYDSENPEYMLEAGIILTHQYRNDEAIKYYKQGMQISKNQPLEKINMETWYNYIGIAYQQKNDFYNSIYYRRKSLEILKKSNPEKNSTDLGVALDNIGLVFLFNNQLDSALAYQKLAFEIIKKNQPESEDIALCYNNLAGTYQKMGKYEDALSFYLKALEINVKLFGNNSVPAQVSYNNIGTLYEKIGKHEDALTNYMLSVSIAEKILGHNHLRTSLVNYKIGLLYFTLESYNKSVEYLLKGKAFYEINQNEYYSDLILIYNKLGVCYTNLELLGESEKYHKLALTTYTRFNKTDNLKLSSLNINLGGIYYKSGNYQLSIEYNQKAYDLLNQNQNKNEVLVCLKILGLSYLAINQTKKAETYIKQIVFDDNLRIDYATSINALGVKVFKEQQYSNSIPIYSYALSLINRVNNNQDFELKVIVLQNLAKANCYNGNKIEALRLFEEAIVLGKKMNFNLERVMFNYNECKSK